MVEVFSISLAVVSVTNLQIANSKIGKFYGFSDKKTKTPALDRQAQ
jgi:hypothetical protein